MAKTFDINRVGGGTFSLVRDADGNYSLKEEGFQQISSLNMIDLGAVATTTTAAKTETAAETAGISTADQTKQAFLLPSQDKQDPFTFEKTLKSAEDVSENLQDVGTVGPNVGSFGQDPTIQSDRQKTEVESSGPVFARTLLEDDFETMVGPKVETPQEKLAVTSANVQSGKVEPPGITNPFKNILGDKLKTEKGSEVTQAGQNINLDSLVAQSQAAKTATQGMGVDPTKQGMIPQMGSLGINPNVGSFGQDPTSLVGGADLEADAGAIPRADIQPVAKKTFVDSVSTALQGVGDFIKGGGFLGGIVKRISKQRNEDAATIALNRSKFNIVTSPGSMQGRIVGNDGSYNPSENLFHGMNRDSSLGNLQNAGQKRIDKRNSASTQARIQKTMTREQRDKFNEDTRNMEKELSGYKKEKVQKKGLDTRNPNEMRNANKQGGNGGRDSGKSIVCTAMYQTTGLQDWAKAMKIWYIYQKRYLTIQHQEGYHKLFKPFVKGMHKSNAIKAIGAHFAKYRTQHLKHVLFKSKPSLLGKVYSKVLETICYWAGKK